MKRKHLIKIYVKGVNNPFLKTSKYVITLVLKNYPTPIIYEQKVEYFHRTYRKNYCLLMGISKALAMVRKDKLYNVNIYISNEELYKELNFLSHVLTNNDIKLTLECIRKYHKLKDKHKLNILLEEQI